MTEQVFIPLAMLYAFILIAWVGVAVITWSMADDDTTVKVRGRWVNSKRHSARQALIGPLWPIVALVFAVLIIRDAIGKDDK